jgi:superfamily II DNA or RNA helicase
VDADKTIVTGLYTGRQKQTELRESESANVIFSSYAMCREGLDIQSLNTIILATSAGDVVQTCGRILRKEHDVSPLVIDIVDNFSTFVSQSKKRDAFYKKSKYAVSTYTWNCASSLDTVNVSSKDILSEKPKTTTKTLIANKKEIDDDELSNSLKYTFIDDD